MRSKLSREALARALGQATANLKKTAKTVIFTVDKEEVRVALSDIIYVEAFAHACRITALDGRNFLYQTYLENRGYPG